MAPKGIQKCRQRRKSGKGRGPKERPALTQVSEGGRTVLKTANPSTGCEVSETQCLQLEICSETRFSLRTLLGRTGLAQMMSLSKCRGLVAGWLDGRVCVCVRACVCVCVCVCHTLFPRALMCRGLAAHFSTLANEAREMGG